MRSQRSSTQSAPFLGFILPAAALLSAAGLAWEIDLTRFASAILSYHYAFVAISLAVSGSGLGAALVYALPEAPGRRLAAPAVLGACVAFLLTAALLPSLANQGSTAALALLALLPFVGLGAAMASLFRAQAAQAPRLYGADLLGAGAGALGAVAGLNARGPFGLLLACAALAALAGLLLSPLVGDPAARSRALHRAWRLALVSLLLLGFSGLALAVQVTRGPLALDYAAMRNAPPDKTIIPILRDHTQGARVIDTRWDAFARTDVVATNDPSRRLVFLDGGAGSYMLAWDGKLSSQTGLRTDLEFLPFLLGPHDNVLVIGAGGGIDVLRALEAGAKHVTAVELNGATVSAVRAAGAYNGNILNRPEVTTVVDDGRHFLQHSHEHFDVILLNLVYTGAAEDSGHALTESYLFTTEAFRLYLDHLTPHGRIGIIGHQGLEGLRALVTGLQALHENGYSYAGALLRSTALMTNNDNPEARPTLAVIQAAPFIQSEVTMLRSRGTGDLNLQPFYVPYMYQGQFKDMATGGQTMATFLQGSDYNVAPTSDNQPFFFDFSFGLPDGLDTALWAAALLVAGLLASVFFLRESQPIRPGQRRFAIWTLSLYMALLGIGFMCIEIPVIQRFILILGTPVLAFTVVVGTLLIGAGLGSMLSARLFTRRAFPAPLAAALAALAVPALVATVQPSLLSLGSGAAILASIALLLPLGVVLGMPFPIGLRIAAEALPGDVALFWSLNALFSVLGSVGAAAIAVQAGFSTVLLCGVLCYLGAAIVLLYHDRAPSAVAVIRH